MGSKLTDGLFPALLRQFRDTGECVASAWRAVEQYAPEIERKAAVWIRQESAGAPYDGEFVLGELVRKALVAAACVGGHISPREANRIVDAALHATEDTLRESTRPGHPEAYVARFGRIQFAHQFMSSVENIAHSRATWRGSSATAIVNVRDLLGTHALGLQHCARAIATGYLPGANSHNVATAIATCHLFPVLHQQLQDTRGVEERATFILNSSISAAEAAIASALKHCVPIPFTSKLASCRFRDHMLDQVTIATIPAAA